MLSRTAMISCMLGGSPKHRRYQLHQTPVAALLPVDTGRPTVLTPVNKNWKKKWL